MSNFVYFSRNIQRQQLLCWLWLFILLASAGFLGANFVRGTVRELGGIKAIQKKGLPAALKAALPKIAAINSPTPALKQAARRNVLFLLSHLLGLGIIIYLIWNPVIALRRIKGKQCLICELEKLPEGYYVLPDVRVQTDGKPCLIDYVLVSSYGVWLVDVRSHVGRIVGGEDDYEWQHIQGSGIASFYNPIRQNRSFCSHIEQYLAQEGISASVHSIVVFPYAELETPTLTPVVRVEQLVPTILQLDSSPKFSSEQVEQLVMALQKLQAPGAAKCSSAPMPCNHFSSSPESG